VQVPHDEGVATHINPESCAVAREGNGEALTGEHTGQPLSRESFAVLGCRRRSRSGRQYGRARQRERSADPAWSRDPGMYARSLSGNREILRPTARQSPPVRIGEVRSRTR
jgi:hypothetical protein